MILGSAFEELQSLYSFGWGLRLLAIVDGTALLCSLAVSLSTMQRAASLGLLWGPLLGVAAITRFSPRALALYGFYHAASIVVAALLLLRAGDGNPALVVVPLWFHAWMLSLVWRLHRRISPLGRQERRRLQSQFHAEH